MRPETFIYQLNQAIKVKNYQDILKLFKDPEVDVNQYGRNGWTPLHCAIAENNPALVKLFLLMGANPYQRYNEVTPIEHAFQIRNPDIIQLLSKAETHQMTKISEFMDAIEAVNVKKVEQMLADGVPYNDCQFFSAKYTALGVAVTKKSFPIVEQLVKRGAMVQESEMHTWLKEQEDQTELRPIVQLLKLEKQRQIQILQAFCNTQRAEEEHKLADCGTSIIQIQSNFDQIVETMRLNSDRSNEGKKWDLFISDKLNSHIQYPFGFVDACQKMKELVIKLQKNNQLTPAESFDLMGKTASLIDNPAEYKEFLSAAKNCQLIEGGKLTAYIILIAGWAAKIVSAGHWGNAYIKLAHEKLETIAATEELANTSAARLGKI